ncbi:PREDICTED: pre-mRNA-processing factor 17-like [Ipomoea nil]|uniref:pre-mRNA-processing factor 17-like n=1 Tax=Ipomoea nil TaxID=35883 RepID=UPI0009008B05|nr:PREDICTED: pre-mRNA-processing factor 17-like [Ipomoea nil]
MVRKRGSWIAPSKDARPQNDHYYIPKKLAHTWSGHTKGVSTIRFFPKHGYLIISAGMDTKVKIWDVFNSGKCMRTYMATWGTQRRAAVVVKAFADESASSKTHIQWDMNSGQIIQEYDQHLGAVNTITFVDDNRRFMTSNSDDKYLRVWEFGIPVVIKYISESHMHSMPSISPHPNGNWLAAQSLDNQILIYSTRERFQLKKKKRFAGHIVVGYACQINFSPDGQFVLSGDGEGRCCEEEESKLMK